MNEEDSPQNDSSTTSAAPDDPSGERDAELETLEDSGVEADEGAAPADAPGCPVAHGSGEGWEDSGDTIDQPEERLTYGSYLKVEELLDLQQFESVNEAHDELLFITIHQAYELWFKQILYELDTVARCMEAVDVYEASRLLSRAIEIEKLLVQQIHLLETMTPRDFLSFRQALNPASGFQSVQFREVEFLTGMKSATIARSIHMSDEQRARLRSRYEEPSLRVHFYRMLRKLDFDVAVPDDDEGFDDEARERTLGELLKIYSRPEKHYHVYSLAERLVEHDQKILLWRFHHVRVVERLIGTKMGTGGSAGVGYLSSTLDKRAFRLLWEVRGHLDDQTLYGTHRGRTETRGGSDEALLDELLVRNDE
jgi:tryptophan 2,3-dioxygenase